LSDPNAIDKDMREHVKALQDRGLDFIHVSRDLQHIAEYVMWLAEQNDLLKKNGIDLTATAKRQLSKFFMDNLTRFETVSVRRYLSIAKDRLTMPDRWKRLQEASFKPLEAAREPSSKKKNSNDGDPLSSNKAPITWKHQSDEWGSPQDLFDYLNGFFNFDVDVSASAQNAKCSVFWTKDDDGLKQDWIPGRTYWMNPPYSNAAMWVKKATEASLNGAVVVGLLANRSSTNWYKEYVVPYAQIVLLNGRAKFVPGHRVMTGGAAPFASALAIWPKSAAKVLYDLIEPANVGIMSLKDAA
jgi:site-specific DNA-methyltransferase (adenine-specific)